METFGPLDWRTCNAPALYWIMRGEDELRESVKEEPPQSELMNTRRIVFFALKERVLFGRLMFVPNMEAPEQSDLYRLPDLRFIPILHEKYITLFKSESEEGNDLAAEQYQIGHANFLSDAIKMLYIDGRQEDAAYYYDYLRKNIRERNGQPKPVYLQPLRDFVRRDYLERLRSKNMASGVVYQMLLRAYEAMAMNDLSASQSRQEWAKDIYDAYMQDKMQDLTDRRRLPPFDDMAAQVFSNHLITGALPDDYRARLWKNAPPPLQQSVYDEIEPKLREIADRSKFAMSKAFPEPEGMAEYRRARAAAEAQKPETVIEPGVGR